MPIYFYYVFSPDWQFPSTDGGWVQSSSREPSRSGSCQVGPPIYFVLLQLKCSYIWAKYVLLNENYILCINYNIDFYYICVIRRNQIFLWYTYDIQMYDWTLFWIGLMLESITKLNEQPGFDEVNPQLLQEQEVVFLLN